MSAEREQMGRKMPRRQALFPNVRRSPYFELTEREGAELYMTYNHMYMPIGYGRDPREEYRALTAGVTLWDVGAERQTELRGPDASAFADYLCTRDLSDLAVGACRYTLVCDDDGLVMTEPIVLMPFEDTVWISHGDVDLELWARGLAAGSRYDVEVRDPDVAPMQLQGPRSSDVMREVAPEAALLKYYRCAPVEIAGVPCIVSRTGWSGEHGYEVFPLDSGRAADVWRALREAGGPYDLMVTGPNLSRALEHGITDTHYFVNCGMDAYEAGRGRLVDLDHGPFVGEDALRASSSLGQRRHSVGLLADEDLPVLEEYWPVLAGAEEVGSVLWTAYSFALEHPAAIALLSASVSEGDDVVISYPGGAAKATVTSLPFVS